MIKKIKIPTKSIHSLKIGDIVYLTGTLFTMRDNAHRRALEYLKRNKKLPVNLKGQTIWHCGPIIKKVKNKYKVVVAGSTTSYRLNKVTPVALEKIGYKIVIGKGGMDVEKAMKKNKAVYLATVGGTAAWLGQKIKSVEKVYWLDLGIP
ncbi:fumarate hydratase C-terminal domain-containing protein, partial [bacterium]|nr:fumarate hydratase C-terminal domain-containing protein [bacterium]